MKNRQFYTGLAAAIGMVILILDGKTALSGAREGIDLCLRTAIPALFPLFFLSSILIGSGASDKLSGMGKLFRLPGGAGTLLIPAFLGGYPVGAKCVVQAYRSQRLSKESAERMLAFTNNAGPAFFFGVIAQMFPKPWMVWILWGIHIVSAVAVSRLFPLDGASIRPVIRTTGQRAVMQESAAVMATVCGWIILFRVILAFLDRWFFWLLSTNLRVLLTGLLELTNGCCELTTITSLPARFVICSGMLAAGGLCVTMQTLSVISGLSCRYYCLGKCMQTLFSLLLSFSFAYHTPIPLVFFVPLLLKKKKGVAFHRHLMYNEHT